MKRRIILFTLLPCLCFYLGFSQLGPNLSKYELDEWWTLDNPPSVVISDGETIEIVAGENISVTPGDSTITIYQIESAEEFLDRYDYQDYQEGQNGVIEDSLGVLCPWQSWRFVTYQSFQIDLILSPKEFDAFEPRLIDEDLIFYAMGGNRDGLNITERGYYAQLHVPGINSPIIKHYDFIFPQWACDFENNNPQWGWHRRILENGMAMAVKELPGGLFHVSMAKFVKHDGY